MAIPVLLILAALWAAVLVPPLLRARADRVTPVGDFASRLDVLGRAVPSTRPRRSVSHNAYAVGLARVPGVMSPTQRRRRDVLVVLGTVTGVVFLLALFTRSALTLLVLVLMLGVSGAYIGMLVQIRRREQERKYRRVERLVPAARLERRVATNATPAYRRRVVSASH